MHRDVKGDNYLMDRKVGRLDVMGDGFDGCVGDGFFFLGQINGVEVVGVVEYVKVKKSLM